MRLAALLVPAVVTRFNTMMRANEDLIFFNFKRRLYNGYDCKIHFQRNICR